MRALKTTWMEVGTTCLVVRLVEVYFCLAPYVVVRLRWSSGAGEEKIKKNGPMIQVTQSSLAGSMCRLCVNRVPLIPPFTNKSPPSSTTIVTGIKKGFIVLPLPPPPSIVHCQVRFNC